jgi:TetR/AcrR family transcriptional regulator, regulator of cefoperazone and chloramphenicol sensitivity
VRSMMDGSAGGEAMFRRMVEAGEEWLTGTDIPTVDPRAYSAVLVAMQMGMFLLGDQIARAIGTEPGHITPLGRPRVLRAAVEIFSHPLLTPEQRDQVLKALEQLTDPEE